MGMMSQLPVHHFKRQCFCRLYQRTRERGRSHSSCKIPKMVNGLELSVSFVHTENEYRSAYTVNKQARLATPTEGRETLVKRLCNLRVQYVDNFRPVDWLLTCGRD